MNFQYARHNRASSVGKIDDENSGLLEEICRSASKKFHALNRFLRFEGSDDGGLVVIGLHDKGIENVALGDETEIILIPLNLLLAEAVNDNAGMTFAGDAERSGPVDGLAVYGKPEREFGKNILSFLDRKSVV